MSITRIRTALAVPAALSALLIAVAGITALAGSPGFQQVVGEMMIRAVVVIGIFIFVGNSGVLSFGHISFMAIGAYAAAWFTCCTLPMVKTLYTPGLPHFLLETSYPFGFGLAAAAGLSGSVALMVGFVLVRLSGIASSIATFALLAMIYVIYSNWSSVTGGTSSISNIPVHVGLWVATAAAVGAIAVAYLHKVSRYGLMLRASRDDPVASRAAGVNIMRMRLIAFVLSAACVGAGGAIYANFMGILTVDAFYLQITFLTLAMLIVGGIGSLSGAVIGVVFVTFVTELLRMLESGIALGNGPAIRLPAGTQEVILGAVMIAVLILRPAGLMGGKEVLNDAYE